MDISPEKMAEILYKQELVIEELVALNKELTETLAQYLAVEAEEH